MAIRNDMDGVPGFTQTPIAPGARFVYEFTVPNPGTYFFHPHSGVQLDRGLYGVLIVEDLAEPGRYDREAVIVLDDWTDGVGSLPTRSWLACWRTAWTIPRCQAWTTAWAACITGWRCRPSVWSPWR